MQIQCEYHGIYCMDYYITLKKRIKWICFWEIIELIELIKFEIKSRISNIHNTKFNRIRYKWRRSSTCTYIYCNSCTSISTSWLSSWYTRYCWCYVFCRFVCFFVVFFLLRVDVTSPMHSCSVIVSFSSCFG